MPLSSSKARENGFIELYLGIQKKDVNRDMLVERKWLSDDSTLFFLREDSMSSMSLLQEVEMLQTQVQQVTWAGLILVSIT